MTSDENVLGEATDADVSSFSTAASVSGTGQFQDSFHFWNGDEYEGEFAIIKEKQKLVMEGKGIYRTSDRQVYEGLWEEDCLKEADRVIFPDKSIFSGSLDEMMIQGSGKYRFKEDVEIEGDFIDNRLIGRVYLTDPTHHVWRGDVKEADVYVDFRPLHPFWQSVLSLPSKYRPQWGEAEN